jgi:hypothetical protein
LTSSSSHSAWQRRSRRHERTLKTHRALAAFVLVTVTLAVAGAIAASAGSSAPSTYLQAVDQAYAIVTSAQANDTSAARDAIAILVAGTGDSQPEIITDLRSAPPDFQDATVRLKALHDALGNPAKTSDPTLASQRLHDVMSMHRYDALHHPPSLLDRFLQWVGDRINDILRFLFGRHGNGGAGVPVPDVFFYALGALVLAAIVFLIVRSARGHVRDGNISIGSDGPHTPADYFAEADRLAAAADYVRAIRALCAGVAATLAGERTWEGSPLTVREIFSHAPDPARLRPLLLPFEAAIYGGRDVDATTYERAALVAAPFRKTGELAA